MKKLLSVVIALSLGAAGPMPVVFAQDSGAPMLGAIQPGAPQFSQQELDQMLAPIALYPDALLSQILMAATYPLEVVQAARWARAHPSLKGEDAVRAVEGEDWDPSVKSLVAFPQVLVMMDERVSWTERLGNAFLSQQEQVTTTVQDLRQKAYAAGNLASNEQQRVEQQGGDIIVEPANPQMMYVPYYDPNVVYGGWWYPSYPPVYWAPPYGYYASPRYSGFWIGPAIVLSAGFFFGAFDWHRRHVQVINTSPFYFRGPGSTRVVSPGLWQHDPGHRRGIAYRDEAMRQRFSSPAGTSRSVQPERRGFAPGTTPSGAPRDRQDRSNFAPRTTRNVSPNSAPNSAPQRVRPAAPERASAPVRAAPPPQPSAAPQRAAPPAQRQGGEKGRDRPHQGPQEKSGEGGNRERRGANDGNWQHAPVNVAAMNYSAHSAPAGYSSPHFSGGANSAPHFGTSSQQGSGSRTGGAHGNRR